MKPASTVLDYRTPQPVQPWKPPPVTENFVITVFIFVLFGGLALLCLAANYMGD